jgi:hypothetical protein
MTGHRVAIVGCGAWAAQSHLPALRALPEVEVVACVDQDGAGGRRFAAAHGIPHWFGSLPGGERYQRLGLDGGPAERVPLGEEAGGRSGYARRYLRDFLGQPGGQSPGTMPTLAQAASVQHVLDTAAKATERWMAVPGAGT